MKEKLTKFINALFINAPDTQAARDAKEELLSNVNAKYDDYIASGKNEETALNLTIASIGDISEILTSLGSKQVDEQLQKSIKKRTAIVIAISVMLFILCPLPLFIFQDAVGLCGLLIMVALGVGLIIFNSIISKRDDPDDLDYEDIKFDNLENPEEKGKSSAGKVIVTSLWLAIVAIYFIVSYATTAWHITWIIFLIGPAIQNIILAFMTKSRKKRKNLIVGACWLIITAIYFIVSFATMAWGITWTIFLIAPAIQNIILAIMTKSIKKRKNLIVEACWLIITAIYFIVSFATMAWGITWIIFLISASISNAIKAVFSN